MTVAKKGVVLIHGREYKTVALRVSEFTTEDKYKGWGIQTKIVDIDNVKVVVQCVIRNDSDRIVGSGFAEEFRASGKINRTSALENAECVPLTVRILTRDGFKHYHQLTEGEMVAAYDGENIVFTELQKVSVFENQPLVKMKNSRFSATCTPDHKWVIDGQLQQLNKAGITATTKLTVAAPVMQGKAEKILDAEKLGWLFGDCTVKYANGLPSSAQITQSKHLDAATRLFGEPRLRLASGVRRWADGRESPVRDNYSWEVPAKEVRRIMGGFSVSSSADLSRAVLGMGLGEMEAFLSAIMLCDGSENTHAKTDRNIVEAVQLAMFLAGNCVSKITERKGNGMTTKPCYTVRGGSTAHRLMSKLKPAPIPPQDVWCPTTKHGTWVGDFGGQLSITGNTSAIGRALASIGLGGEEYASANEVQGAIKQQKLATPAQVAAIKALIAANTISAGHILASFGHSDPERLFTVEADRILNAVQEAVQQQQEK